MQRLKGLEAFYERGEPGGDPLPGLQRRERLFQLDTKNNDTQGNSADVLTSRRLWQKLRKQAGGK